MPKTEALPVPVKISDASGIDLYLVRHGTDDIGVSVYFNGDRKQAGFHLTDAGRAKLAEALGRL